MSKENPIHILLADDHAVMRDGLAAIMKQEQDMTVVGEASNGKEAVELFRARQPDVTLMDLRMPEMDGVEATTAIRAQFPNARILVLTTYDGDEDIYRGLRAGAKGYLLKDAGREELLEAIRAVHAGQTRIPPDVTAKLLTRMSGPDLSARELEVLRLMTLGSSNQEIAAALFIAEATVRTHVNNILSKLEASDRTQAVTTALRRGIVHLE
jgi:two-component system NarL family response regulator